MRIAPAGALFIDVSFALISRSSVELRYSKSAENCSGANASIFFAIFESFELKIVIKVT